MKVAVKYGCVVMLLCMQWRGSGGQDTNGLNLVIAAVWGRLWSDKPGVEHLLAG